MIYLISDTDEVLAVCSNTIEAARIRTRLPCLRFATEAEFRLAEKVMKRSAAEWTAKDRSEYNRWRRKTVAALDADPLNLWRGR